MQHAARQAPRTVKSFCSTPCGQLYLPRFGVRSPAILPPWFVYRETLASLAVRPASPDRGCVGHYTLSVISFYGGGPDSPSTVDGPNLVPSLVSHRRYRCDFPAGCNREPSGWIVPNSRSQPCCGMYGNIAGHLPWARTPRRESPFSSPPSSPPVYSLVRRASSPASVVVPAEQVQRQAGHCPHKTTFHKRRRT